MQATKQHNKASVGVTLAAYHPIARRITYFRILIPSQWADALYFSFSQRPKNPPHKGRIGRNGMQALLSPIFRTPKHQNIVVAHPALAQKSANPSTIRFLTLSQMIDPSARWLAVFTTFMPLQLLRVRGNLRQRHKPVKLAAFYLLGTDPTSINSAM